jgi:hypothetical protein
MSLWHRMLLAAVRRGSSASVWPTEIAVAVRWDDQLRLDLSYRFYGTSTDPILLDLTRIPFVVQIEAAEHLRLWKLGRNKHRPHFLRLCPENGCSWDSAALSLSVLWSDVPSTDKIETILLPDYLGTPERCDQDDVSVPAARLLLSFNGSQGRIDSAGVIDAPRADGKSSFLQLVLFPSAGAYED